MPKSKHRKKPARPEGTPSGQTAVARPSGGEGRGASAEPAKKKSVGPVAFFRQVRDEARKVTWTSRNETMVSTVMVLIMVVIASLFFFAVDQALRFVVPLILQINA